MEVLEHLAQQPVYELKAGGLDLSITNGVITLWSAAVLVFVLFAFLSRRLKMVPGKLQNAIEVVILFLRDEVGAQLGSERDRWMPLIISLFFFILFNNLLGLIPGFSGVTGNINTTAALALVIFITVQAVGVARHGLWGYLKSIIPGGVPLPIAIFMIPIEFISQLAKPFSLAVRLFANMFAGHAVMLMLISLIFIFKSYLILPLPVIGNAVVLAFYLATAVEGH